MRVLSLLCWILAGQVHAQLLDPCQPPLGSIRDCPRRYLPTPHPASIAERKRIEGILLEAAPLRAREEETRKKLNDELSWLKKGQANPKLSPSTLKALAKDYEIAARDWREAFERKKAVYDRAIEEAQKAYGLVPPVTDFSKDAGFEHWFPLDDRYREAKPWKPTYSKEEKFDEQTGKWRQYTQDEKDKIKADNEAKARALKLSVVSGPPAARTWADARISIFEDAFTDPDTLALMIHHETSHWVDAMARGGSLDSNPRNGYLSEETAYRLAADFAGRLGKPEVSAHYRAVADQYGRQTVALMGRDLNREQIRAFYPHWLDATLPARFNPVATETESPDGQIEEGDPSKDKDLQEAALEISKRLKREREEREERAKREEEESRRRQEETRREFERLLKLYGFVYLSKGPGFHILALEEDPYHNHVWFPFVYLHEARSSLFLARSCYDKEAADEAGDTLTILDQYFQDEQFRSRVELLVGEPGRGCIRKLLEQHRPGSGEKKFRNEMKEHFKREQREDESRWREQDRRRREEERARRRKESHDRERDPSNSGPCGDGGSFCGRFPRLPF